MWIVVARATLNAKTGITVSTWRTYEQALNDKLARDQKYPFDPSWTLEVREEVEA